MTLDVAEMTTATKHAMPRVDGAVAASPVLGRIGSLETRLAATPDEIRAAQVIRYRVFVEEMGARLFTRGDDGGLSSMPSTPSATTSSCSTNLWRAIRPIRSLTILVFRQDVAEAHSGFYWRTNSILRR